MRLRVALVSLALAIPIAEAAAAPMSREDEAACRPDVRRLCHNVREGAGNDAYLSCLQEHRSRLSRRCRRVLEEHNR